MKNINKLGLKGDVVNVSDGHARNFLFPQNLAVQATPDALKKIEQDKKIRVSREEKAMNQAARLAKALDSFKLKIMEKANEEGGLYGAVTSATIAEALGKAGFAVDASMVGLAEPLKKVGDQKVVISLPHGFEAKINVAIEAKK